MPEFLNGYFLAGAFVGAVVALVGVAALLASSAGDLAKADEDYDEGWVDVTRFRHEKGQLAKDSERIIRIQDAEMERRRRAEGAG